MSIYMCRWPNGDLSFVHAPNKDDALFILDELGDAQPEYLSRVTNFMLDFTLTADGRLELLDIGEACEEQIWDKAYPILAAAERTSDERDGEPYKALIADAVQKEKERIPPPVYKELTDAEMEEIRKAEEKVNFAVYLEEPEPKPN